MSARLEVPTTLNGASAVETAQQQCQAAFELEAQLNRLLSQQEVLREEIRRGKQCMEHAQTELAERRSRLEDWPNYERDCGTNCLPHLTESVRANRRVERFLSGWIKRRQGQLDALDQTIARFARQHHFKQQPAELVVPRRLRRRADCRLARAA